MSEFQSSKLKVQGREVIAVELMPDDFIFDFDNNKYVLGKCDNCYKDD